MMEKKIRIEGFLGRMFLLCVCILGSFFIIDYLSIFFISSRSPLERQFPVGQARQPKPYVMFGGAPNGGMFNPQGYIGKVPGIPKKEDEFRVFVLGGSTVVHGRPPIAELLEQQFAGLGLSHVKIYNYGVVSSVSGQDLARIVFEISDLEPNLIIFYSGANDVIHARSFDPRPGYPFNFLVYESNPLLESSISDYPALALLAYGSNILRSLVPNFFIHEFVSIKSLRKKQGWMTREWKERVASNYLNNLVKADKISKAFHADFIAFFQPLLYFKNHLTDEEKAFFRENEKKYYLDMRQRILSKIDQVKKESGVQIVDISLLYQDTSDWVFTDMVHTRQTSKKRVAEALLNHLVNLRLIQDIQN